MSHITYAAILYYFKSVYSKYYIIFNAHSKQYLLIVYFIALIA